MQKGFWHIQQIFMIKDLNKVQLKGTNLNIIVLCGKPTADISRSMVKRKKYFLYIRNKMRLPTLANFIQHTNGSLNQSNQARLKKKKSWAYKNWCIWTVVLEKTLESPLDCEEIPPVHPKGDQSWVFTGRTDVEAETPILWPPDENSWLIRKDPDAGRDWGQEEKETTEDEMAGGHRRLNGHEFE